MVQVYVQLSLQGMPNKISHKPFRTLGFTLVDSILVRLLGTAKLLEGVTS